MKASYFDKKSDEGGDVTALLDMRKANCPGVEARRVYVDFPAWMVQSLDKEAHRLGVTRQALIKLWLTDKLEQHARS